MCLELRGGKEEVRPSHVGPCVERKGAAGDNLRQVLLVGSWAWVLRGPGCRMLASGQASCVRQLP